MKTFFNEQTTNFNGNLFNPSLKLSDNIRLIKEATDTFSLELVLEENAIRFINEEAILNERFLLEEDKSSDDSKSEATKGNLKKWADKVIDFIERTLESLKKMITTVLKNLFDSSTKVLNFAKKNKEEILKSDTIDLNAVKLNFFTSVSENNKVMKIGCFPDVSRLGIAGGTVTSESKYFKMSEKSREIFNMARKLPDSVNKVKKEISENQSKLNGLKKEVKAAKGKEDADVSKLNDKIETIKKELKAGNQRIKNVNLLSVNIMRALRAAVEQNKSDSKED